MNNLNNYPDNSKNLTTNNFQLEWLLEMITSLINGKFSGGIEIYFKEGGISGINKPKEKFKEKVITHNQIKRAVS